MSGSQVEVTIGEAPRRGREATAPSFIKEIQEVQGGKKHHTMPK
jgi:hypothetical protein